MTFKKPPPYQTPIQYIKGVGPRLGFLLQKKNIYTAFDALYYAPRAYENRKDFKPIEKLLPNQKETACGIIKKISLIPLQSGRGKIFELVIQDNSGVIRTKWFRYNLKYMLSRFKIGMQVVFTGEIKIFKYQKEMTHPDIEVIENPVSDSLHFGRIVPIYEITEGLYQKTLRRIVKNVLDISLTSIVDPLPQDICHRQKLLDLKTSLEQIHFPDSMNHYPAAKQRLIFDEFFFLELGLALKRANVSKEKTTPYLPSQKLKPLFFQTLPFQLTEGQKNAIIDIEKDLEKHHPMNRLLQGDVGSGKTLVALISSLSVLEKEHQVALMVPTEILAEQHFHTISSFLQTLGIKTALLKSDLKKSERIDALKNIKEGKNLFVIGTHALIQDDVEFQKLGFIIIDEQHRFGVEQRLLLKKKASRDGGYFPHLLVMTATPIPRTLALTAYGDLDMSLITELPPGRKPIKTKVVHEKDRLKLYEFMKKQLLKGNQAYVVYPLIEESEKMDLKDATQMTDHLKKIFQEFHVELLHGKMSGEEKKEIMAKFKNKTIHVLVSTTVIEVGIDVPNSNMMVIEHAERFGLSQLHQLRGRIGRGEDYAFCFLLAHRTFTEESKQRLKAMEEHASGFKLAEIDLTLRGPGEFLGTRQSGISNFQIANLMTDIPILLEARKEAFDLIEKDPFLSLPEHLPLKEALKLRWQDKINLIDAG